MAARILIVRGFFEGKTFHIPNGSALSIGRGSDNSVQILDKSLSRRHCEISVASDGHSAIDSKVPELGLPLHEPLPAQVAGYHHAGPP